MHLAQVAQAVHGQLQGANAHLRGVTIDSRGDCQGQLFIALKGECFDAHRFIQQAYQGGATAAMIEDEVDTPLPTVLVSDTHLALKDLAAWWRAQFVIPMIAVTGSVGKTSVKEMLGSIFSEFGSGVITKGNLNNEIGLPLTLLRLSEKDHYAIVEMGMNHAGEIARLSNIAKPTIALINNAAAAHLQDLGSVEAVAYAKGEIFQGLSEDGIAVINADDYYADLWRGLIGKRKLITFGLDNSADVSAAYKLSGSGIKLHVTALGNKFKVKLPALGLHNVSNALAAIAVALAGNISVQSIKQGLAKYRPLHGRLNILPFGQVSLIDDTYNANPASVSAAIKVLAQYQNSTLIVGDMAELGEAAKQEHRRIGELASSHNIDRIYACGEYAELVVSEFSGPSYVYPTQDELIQHLSVQSLGQHEQQGILVKGSRSAAMERTVEHLIKVLQATQAQDNAVNLDVGVN